MPLLSPPTVSAAVVSNYKALAGVSSKATIMKVVYQKTDNRHAAENSLMLTVDLLCVVASTHLFLDERGGIYQSFKKKITAGEQKLL